MTEHITNGEVPLTEVEQIQIEKVLAIVRKLSRQQQEVILEGMRQLREEQEVSKAPEKRAVSVHFRRVGDTIVIDGGTTLKVGEFHAFPDNKGTFSLKKEADGALFLDVFDKENILKSSSSLIDGRMYGFNSITLEPKLFARARDVLNRLS